MRCLYCCVVLYTRNPNRRSSILLLALISMFIYMFRYDVIYPYEFHIPQVEDFVPSSTRNYVFENVTCSFCTYYPVSGEAKDLGFQCVRTRTSPRTTVCLFDEWSDMYISHDIQYTGVWEPKVLRDFQEILGKNYDSGVIDLGANIGFYTLVAARMGHKVVSVEPSRESIYRIHRALFLENLGHRVFVLENGISDKRGEAALSLNGNNQGDHRLRTDFIACSGAHCSPVVKTITMDDINTVIGSNFSSAILKMDIQGFEHRAFTHATQLFDNIHIDYIFMEWFLMGEHYVHMNHTSTDKNLVKQMLSFLFFRDYRPYSLTSDGGKPLDPAVWHKWPFDIIWIRLPDPMERRTILSTHFRNWPSR